MAYKKDQGRYARMSAFWGLFLLVGYGCLNDAGLLQVLRGWIDSEPLTESPWPLLGDIDAAKLLTLGVLAGSGFALYRVLNSAKVADMLIDTENELKKVTWPSSAETLNGSLAVVATVAVMLGFLYLTNIFLAWLLPALMQAGGTA